MGGFREFLTKSNALALAIGVIIGGALGAVVNSLVNDILMPPIGYALGGIDFSAPAIQARDDDRRRQGSRRRDPVGPVHQHADRVRDRRADRLPDQQALHQGGAAGRPDRRGDPADRDPRRAPSPARLGPSRIRRRRRRAGSCPGRGPSSSPRAGRLRAASVSGAAASASSSTQKTYSQARSRLGRDSSSLMFRPCSANTRSAARSVPGSFLTAITSVVRIAVPADAAAPSVAAAGGRKTRNRVRLPGRSPISSARTSRPKSAAARGDRTAAEPRSARSTIDLPAPAVL